MRHAFLIRDLDPPRGPSSDEVIAMLVASGWTVDPRLPVGFCREWYGPGQDAVLVYAEKEPGEGEQKLTWSAYDLILGNRRLEHADDPRYADGRPPEAEAADVREWVVCLPDGAGSDDALETLDRLMGLGFVPRHEAPMHGHLRRRYLHGFFRDDRSALETVEGVARAIAVGEETG